MYFAQYALVGLTLSGVLTTE